ncbi:MAG: PAP2 family protein, partial [Bacteroidia bacterium]|nr:PAP2 family protein [Bacteroidia bacterium]
MRKLLTTLIFYLGFLPFSPGVLAQDPTVETIGDVGIYAMPVVTLATTLILEDSKGTWQFTKGLILTEAVTFGLKATINKTRPDL